MTDTVAAYNNGSWSNVDLSTVDVVSGWVQEPNVRGTWDLLWTNLFTVFLCAWTMLNLNVPEPGVRDRTVLWRRVFWMTHAISGPEFILAYAAGQRQSASQSVREYNRLFLPLDEPSATTEQTWQRRLRELFRRQKTEWRQEHGFFADMGGVRLVLTDGTDFPVNWRHIFWLKQNSLIEWRASDLPVEVIRDQSKQDPLIKIITSLQVGYRIIDSIARWAQGLRMTTLELSTVASVIIAILTTILWLPKPADVRTPHYIYGNIPLSYLETFRQTTDKGMKEPKWKDTPLDFVDDLRPSWALTVRNKLEDANWTRVAAFWEYIGGPLVRRVNTPIQRFPDDRLPHAFEDYTHGMSSLVMLALAMLTYPAILMAGWNFWFPTNLEKLLWRISSLFLLVATAGIWLTVTAFWLVKLARRRGKESREKQAGQIERARRTWTGFVMDPALSLNDRLLFAQNESDAEFFAIAVLAIAYTLARWYQVIGVFVELRSLPSSAFQQVDWSRFLPHF